MLSTRSLTNRKPICDDAVVPIAPSAVPGASLSKWWDTSDITKLWQDSARTIPVVAINDPVGAIDEKVGGVDHAVNATAGQRPLWAGAALGAKYDGVDDRLVFPRSALPYASDNYTIIYQARSNADTSYLVMGFSVAGAQQFTMTRALGAYAASARAAAGPQLKTATIGIAAGASTNTFSTLAATFDTALHLVSMMSNAAGENCIAIDLDTNEIANVRGLAPIPFGDPGGTFTGIAIGAQTAAAGAISNPFDGWVRHLLVYSTALTIAQIKGVCAWLRAN